MLANLTVSSLVLQLSLGKSPLLAMPRARSVTLLSSHFSKLVHPIVYVPVLPSSMLTAALTVESYSLRSLPDNLTTGHAYSTRGASYTELEDSFVLEDGSITLNNCTFSKCTNVCFDLTNATLVMAGTRIEACTTFVDLKQCARLSSITDVTVVSSAIKLTSSRMDVTDCVFESANTGTFLKVEEASHVTLTGCSFAKGGTWNIMALTASSSAMITECNVFQKGNGLITVDSSYLVIDHSCFLDTATNVYKVSGSGKVADADRANDFEKPQCPYVVPTATLSKQKRAFAITTIAVFFAFFTILFLVLSVYVACKAGADKPQEYGELHPVSEEGSDDGVIPSD